MTHAHLLRQGFPTFFLFLYTTKQNKYIIITHMSLVLKIALLCCTSLIIYAPFGTKIIHKMKTHLTLFLLHDAKVQVAGIWV